jgi:hypothetical protein
MRVAVIGSTGQLGSDLVQVLTESGRYGITALPHAQLDITQRPSVMERIGKGGFNVVVTARRFPVWMTARIFPVRLCSLTPRALSKWRGRALRQAPFAFTSHGLRFQRR